MATLPTRPEHKRPLWQLATLLVLAIISSAPILQAQVNSYTMASTMETWEPFEDGNLLMSAPFAADVVEVQLNEPFWFAGTFHDRMWVSKNGFITVGQAPTGGNAMPLSSNEGYAAAFVAFGTALRGSTSGTPQIRYKEVGDQVVVQWRRMARNLSGNNEAMSFQAWLNTANGDIRYVYRVEKGPNTQTAYYPQVGLRGPNNAFPTNVVNRTVANGAETWEFPANGANNNSRMKFSWASPPKYPRGGQTYTYTPPCFPPRATATLLPVNCEDNTFQVLVDVIALNGASTVDVVTSSDGTVHAGVTEGQYLLGPYPVGTFFDVRIERAGPEMCHLELGNYGNDVPCMENGECYSGAFPIPDNGCDSDQFVEGLIPMSGLNDGLGVNTRLAYVEMVVEHPHRGDLRISLRSPQGQTRDLFIQAPSAAATGADLGNPDNCGIGVFTFRDDGAPLSSLSMTDGQVSGAFAPAEALSGFTGDPNGNWIVTICDAASGNIGELRMVHMRFENVDCQGVHGGSAWPGTACDDNDPCTENTIWDAFCNCVGDALPDSDGDGVCDDEDGCPDDPDKVEPGECGCGVPDTDTDGDGVPDCNDGCPLDPDKVEPGICGCGSPEPGTACDDGNPETSNDMVGADCVCRGELVDCEGVAGGNALPGTACDDGNPMTVNDMWTLDCQCIGTITTCPGEVVEMQLNTDAHGGQTSWEIVATSTETMICGGSGYDDHSAIVETCCLPEGCYKLRVYDSFGDGMCCSDGNGGYQLRLQDGRRIIDALDNGHFESTSALAFDQGFCLPLGEVEVRDHHCDRTDWLPADWLQCTPDPLVSAAYGTANESSYGYQFWFFDPHGSYSRRVLITHASHNWWFPVGPENASYLRLNSFVSNPLPQDLELNLAARSLVDGQLGNFGRSCRFMIDTSPDNAPLSQLVDDVDDPKHSCGIAVQLDAGQKIWAEAVSGVSHYQFRFSSAQHSRMIASTGSSLMMNTWSTSPLKRGETYDVQVRLSFDGGATYGEWGAICTIAVIEAPAAQAPEDRDLVTGGIDATMKLWPVPNRGDVLNIIADGLASSGERVELEVYDMYGRVILVRNLSITDGSIRSVIELNGQLATGQYLVTLNTADQRLVQRLIVE